MFSRLGRKGKLTEQDVDEAMREVRVALLEAEKRRSAVMEGRAEEARRLYESAAKESSRLQAERDEALAARRAADLAVEQAAAAEHARTAQLIGAAILAALWAGAWFYLKRNSIGPEKLGAMAADLRAGENPLTVLDRYVDHHLHARVQRAAKLNTDLPGAK